MMRSFQKILKDAPIAVENFWQFFSDFKMTEKVASLLSFTLKLCLKTRNRDALVFEDR
jgi:hypothetical protein